MATISVSFAVLGVEAFINWTSPALPHLKTENSEIQVTDEQGTWIASIYNLGAIAGIPLYPFIFNFTGRKQTLLLLSVFQIICWVMIIFAPNVETLYVARFLGGLTCQAFYKVGLTYIGEIAERKIRGSLIVISRIFARTGNLYIKTAGALLSYRNMNILMLSTPIIFFCIFLFMPESPHFLLNRGQKTEAWKTLSKLRGTEKPEILNPDFKKMQRDITQNKNQDMFAFRKLFCVRGNRRGLFIILLTYTTSSFCGSPAINSYTEEIFGYIDLPLEPKYSATILAGINVCVMFFSLLLVDRMGRRVLALSSGIISTIALVTVACFFFMKLILFIETTSCKWMVVAGFIVFTSGVEVGANTISSVMLSELLALDVKGTGILCITFAGQSYDFVVRSTFLWFNSIAGIYTNFLVYAVFCFVGSLTFFFIAPETKDKSLEEIQDILHARKSEDKADK
ncbi:facilitated trehalose transporter Tret1-like [Belonocnema kinseyi]|uniref:facilitated trehalose transporter Tret1-like n=1 Tax=Belonocnema kinseyi TaxID=2817044 RepID=UPI00143D6445|nr:facilitated trehalose transporter Tret1-like [Belonocnema kinseyi]